MAFKIVDVSNRALLGHVAEPTLIKLAHDDLAGEPIPVSFTNFDMLTCVSVQLGKLNVACTMFAYHADKLLEQRDLPRIGNDSDDFLVVQDLFLLGDFQSYLDFVSTHNKKAAQERTSYVELGDVILLPNGIKGRVYRIAFDSAVRLTLAVEVKPHIHVLVDVPHELAHHRVTN